MDINDIRCDGTRYELNGHQFTVLGIRRGSDSDGSNVIYIKLDEPCELDVLCCYYECRESASEGLEMSDKWCIPTKASDILGEFFYHVEDVIEVEESQEFKTPLKQDKKKEFQLDINNITIDDTLYTLNGIEFNIIGVNLKHPNTSYQSQYILVQTTKECTYSELCCQEEYLKYFLNDVNTKSRVWKIFTKNADSYHQWLHSHIENIKIAKQKSAVLKKRVHKVEEKTFNEFTKADFEEILINSISYGFIQLLKLSHEEYTYGAPPIFRHQR